MLVRVTGQEAIKWIYFTVALNVRFRISLLWISVWTEIETGVKKVYRSSQGWGADGVATPPLQSGIIKIISA